MNRRSILGVTCGGMAVIGLAGCSSILGGFGSSIKPSKTKPRSEVRPLIFIPGQGMAAVNTVRRRYGLAPFQSDSRLQRAAKAHADRMAKTGRYGHEIGPGTQFPTRIAAVGFNGSAGENIGVGYGSVEEAVQGWLDSPRHRKIMLRANYDRAGIAYAFNRSGRNPRYTHFWVLIVGRQGGGGRLRRV